MMMKDQEELFHKTNMMFISYSRFASLFLMSSLQVLFSSLVLIERLKMIGKGLFKGADLCKYLIIIITCI